MPATETVDTAIVGAGAAGLMSGIWAGRTAKSSGLSHRIVVLDGARSLGAKILVAGGGRCNVTHDVVDETAFAGSSRHAMRKVLKRFDVPQAIEFFRELGVELKREETGKLFPVTDDARTVLDGLLRAVREAGVEIRYPWRVERVRAVSPPAADEHAAVRFVVESNRGRQIHAHRVILATGGKSLPKTGSDGHGYEIARNLGHSITPRVFPGLVPLTLPKDHPLCSLSGVSAMARLEVRSGTGKRLVAFTDSTLCTHFGLSGPAVLDISRYFTDARLGDPATQLTMNWLPNETSETLERALLEVSRAKNAVSPGRFLREHGLPARLAEALCEMSGVAASAPAHQFTRELRRELVENITNMKLPVTGDRGYSHAEVTAGGVPLSEIRLETMASRLCPSLHVIGEVCDVDGRIGGYNFQWAWASGYVAGVASAQP